MLTVFFSVSDSDFCQLFGVVDIFSQLHNAHQLAEWCMSHLCVNYNIICTLPKSLRALHPENQEYLCENRWPPVWYLKDFDYYQRCMNEMNRECKQGGRGKIKDENDGCMCFSGGKYMK